VTLRFGALRSLKRLAAIIMLAATAAFATQAAYIAPSELATGEESPYHHGFARHHVDHRASTRQHEVTHVHADGTAHRHAVDVDDGALDEHIQEPGCPCCWNMAVVPGVLPTSPQCTISRTSIGRLAIEVSDPGRGAEPNGPRRPPRPPSIA
jgi:hypothetical protein